MSLPKRIKKSSFKTLGPSDSSAIQNYVVVGGGISGISCAQELYRILQLERDQRKRVVLIVEGRSVKCVSYENGVQTSCDNMLVVKTI